MTDITSSVTDTSRAAARTTVRAILLEADPTLDLTSGGAVDSVLVEGNVAVAAQAKANVDSAYLYQQLKAIAEGTVTITDAQMDALASNYLITRRVAVPASGTVTFIVRDNTSYTIASGFRIQYGSQIYVTSATYIIYPAETTGIDFTIPTNIRLQSAYDTSTGYQYQFQIPFSCTTATPEGIRSPGDIFTLVTGQVNVGLVKAATPFTGGTSSESNAELAARAMSGLVNTSLGGGQNQINALVATVFSSAKASAVGVDSSMQTRGRLNPFGINTGGKLDVYVKTGAVGTTLRVASATVIDKNARTVSLVLDRNSAAGAYSFLPVGLTGVTGMTGSITSAAPTFAAAVLDTFNPEVGAIDLRASANTTVTMVITDSRIKPDLSYVVTMSSNGQVLPNTYGVSVTYMPGTLEIADKLYSEAIRPPGLDVLVKAGAPCAVSLSLSASKAVGYTGPTAAALSSIIAAKINQLPMRQKYLDDYTISQIIKDASTQLSLLSLTMTGSIAAFDGSIVSVSQAGNKLVIPTDTAKKLSYETVFFTITPANVTVNLV